MAAFHGYSCDMCGKVWTLDTCTKVRTTFRGLVQRKPSVQDICPTCIDVLYPLTTPTPEFE